MGKYKISNNEDGSITLIPNEENEKENENDDENS